MQPTQMLLVKFWCTWFMWFCNFSLKKKDRREYFCFLILS